VLLNIDLHTHCYEATLSNSEDAVEKIVKSVKEHGLDGIAVTEHVDKDYGLWVQQVVERNFPNEIIIIPGQEVNTELVHVQYVELYLSESTPFRFIVHPYHLTDVIKYVSTHGNMLHGIEIDNYQHKWEMDHIDKQQVLELAKEYDLMLLKNSDAHSLDNIGRYYNEIELDELYYRASQKSL